jgi:hypothetical protein
MTCISYNECKKHEGCAILGECIFGHKLLSENPSPQAIVQMHYGKSLGAMNRVFCKIKSDKPFNGNREDALEHLKKLIAAGSIKVNQLSKV